MFSLLTMAITLYATPVNADLVLKNGKIWTVDASLPEAEAIAIWRDRILFVGKESTALDLHLGKESTAHVRSGNKRK